MKPILSVVLPVYNGEKYLQEAISSLLAQSFEDFELIIIDDGSTDNTPTILKSYSDPRIQVITNQQNLGIVVSRNIGLSMIQGKYYAPFDADDIALTEKFSRQVAFMDAHPDFSMVGTNVHLINAAGHETGKSIVLPATPGQIPAILLFRNYFIQSSVILRSACLPQGGYQPGFEIGEDWLMWGDMATKGKIWNMPDLLLKRRIHDENVSHQDEERLRQFDVRVLDLLYRQIGIVLTEMQTEALICLKHGKGKTNQCQDTTALPVLFNLIRQQNKQLLHTSESDLDSVLANRWIKWLQHVETPFYKKLGNALFQRLTYFSMKHPIRTFRQ